MCVDNLRGALNQKMNISNSTAVFLLCKYSYMPCNFELLVCVRMNKEEEEKLKKK